MRVEALAARRIRAGRGPRLRLDHRGQRPQAREARSPLDTGVVHGGEGGIDGARRQPDGAAVAAPLRHLRDLAERSAAPPRSPRTAFAQRLTDAARRREQQARRQREGGGAGRDRAGARVRLAGSLGGPREQLRRGEAERREREGAEGIAVVVPPGSADQVGEPGGDARAAEQAGEARTAASRASHAAASSAAASRARSRPRTRLASGL